MEIENEIELLLFDINNLEKQIAGKQRELRKAKVKLEKLESMELMEKRCTFSNRLDEALEKYVD
ncbi:MAG: hypothetical protein AMJ43_07905 [Coxiella sp. DG_40]|nr:MAG: hypothetical protein AMJ43_07905 [Coxiella sp. DG_40]